MKRAGSLLLVSLSGCLLAERITGPIDVNERPCPSDEAFFRDVVDAELLQPDCMQCHREGGFAGGTRFVLNTSGDPDALEENLATLRSLATNEVGGRSIILLKPTLQVSHGGGQRFPEGSERFAILEELVFRFSNPGECYQGPDPNRCLEPGPQPGPAPLRPLSSVQYENTVRDLFRDRVDPTGLFPKTRISNGFTTFVSANIVSEAKAEDILLAAEEIARRATIDLGTLLECAPAQSEEACVAAFVDRFGMRAFRRPLFDVERGLLMSIYRLPDFDLLEKVQMIIEATLESPQFLYIDDTSGTDVGGGVLEADGYAIAQRLSYFLWNTMPDDRLLEAAAAGALADPQQVRAQAERLLADPRAEQVVSAFHRDWLMLFALEEVQKDGSVYPSYSAEMATSMGAEIDRFVNHVVFAQDGRLQDLLTSRLSFSDTLLDAHYGVISGSTGPGDFRETSLPAESRAGLLTRAAFLTKHAHNSASAPIARGVFVIRNMVCQELVIPPGLVAGEIPQIEGSTIRERFAVHRQQEACAACHDEIDPLGFAFERYDGIGAFRTLYENGREIDTTGAYPDLSIEFRDALDLTDRLAESPVVRDCYATQWFRYAVGRVETDADCSLGGIQERFEASGGNVKELMIGIAESDAFRYRRVVE